MPPAPRALTTPRLQLCSFVAKRVALLPWVEFKAFLRKSQDDSRVFVYITWSRIRQDFQYQQEEVLHWASHLEHPQSIGFDANKALEKSDFNQFFQNGDGEEGWRGRMAKKIDDFSPYALVSLRTRLLTHSSPYALISLHTCFLRTRLPTHSTPHCLRSRKVFPVVGTICVSSTCRGMRLSFLERHWMAWSLSGRLDAIELAPPLCKRQPRHPYRHERMTRDEKVSKASPERLHPSRRCLCPQRC